MMKKRMTSYEKTPIKKNKEEYKKNQRKTNAKNIPTKKGRTKDMWGGGATWNRRAFGGDHTEG